MVALSILIFFRFLPILVVAPVLFWGKAPVLVRVVVAVALSVCLSGGASGLSNYGEVRQLTFMMLISEFLVGVSVAFALHSAVAALQVMGQLIDFQIGFAAAAVFDPSTERTVSLSGEVFTIALFLTILMTDLHYEVLLSIKELILVVPLGTSLFGSDFWVGILGKQFVLAFIFASPVVVSIWLFDLALSFMARSMPQVQIYFVALPVKTAVGLIALAWLSKGSISQLNSLIQFSLGAG